ncbi:MAG TPA: hypothetical protein PKM25_18450, partial [Candidatus Ozemobacteraceae bacterium]|nr:hypothetical protein [Candidatus Ozemobacteraceae bacterium]
GSSPSGGSGIEAMFPVSSLPRTEAERDGAEFAASIRLAINPVSTAPSSFVVRLENASVLTVSELVFNPDRPADPPHPARQIVMPPNAQTNKSLFIRVLSRASPGSILRVQRERGAHKEMNRKIRNDG